MTSNVDWEKVKAAFKVGTIVQGFVRSHEPYGMFVDIPGIPFRGLVQITDFKDEGRMSAAEYPALGSSIDACVLGFKDIGQQIWLGLKPSQNKGHTNGVSAKNELGTLIPISNTKVST
jgi:ribosomal protein S1